MGSLAEEQWAAEQLEHQIDALVNEAYVLTPEDAALPWDVAPPRMPLGAAALAEMTKLPRVPVIVSRKAGNHMAFTRETRCTI